MQIEEFSRSWKIIDTPSVFQGYQATHPLRLYYGLDVTGNMDFVMQINKLPDRIPPSTKSINIIVTRREDGQLLIHFQLIEKDDSDIFIRLCHDLAESTSNHRDATNAEAALLNRYVKWKRLLDRDNKGLLSSTEIKGLLGELLFLERYLAPRHGYDDSITGWIGSSGAHRDFVVSDLWFEIKAIDPGSIIVNISSVDQLDTDNPGQLVLMVLEKTNRLDLTAISLPQEVAALKLALVDNPISLSQFENKLTEAGYFYDPLYDEDKYVLRRIHYYDVSSNFPRIRRKDLPKGIVKLSYEIGIDSLSQFENNKME